MGDGGRGRRLRPLPFSPGEASGANAVRVVDQPVEDAVGDSGIADLGVPGRHRQLASQQRAFSKKWENLKAALALHFAPYNFCRIHGSLRITPAMAAGITHHPWDL